jgi:hypothetical protein
MKDHHKDRIGVTLGLKLGLSQAVLGLAVARESDGHLTDKF